MTELEKHFKFRNPILCKSCNTFILLSKTIRQSLSVLLINRLTISDSTLFTLMSCNSLLPIFAIITRTTAIHLEVCSYSQGYSYFYPKSRFQIMRLIWLINIKFFVRFQYVQKCFEVRLCSLVIVWHQHKNKMIWAIICNYPWKHDLTVIWLTVNTHSFNQFRLLYFIIIDLVFIFEMVKRWTTLFFVLRRVSDPWLILLLLLQIISLQKYQSATGRKNNVPTPEVFYGFYFNLIRKTDSSIKEITIYNPFDGQMVKGSFTFPQLLTRQPDKNNSIILFYCI